MNINDAALEIIKRNEGLRLAAYYDIANIPTVGYGHTPAKIGQTITQAQADQLLAADIQWAEDAVLGAVSKVPTTSNQFSAMVSLTFNIGAAGFKGSSILRKHLARDYQGAADAFLLWDKATINGALQVVSGLLRRRGEERALYLTPDADNAPSTPQSNGIDASKVLDLVAQLQQALLDAGYYKGTVDKNFGGMSYAALRAFTKDHADLL